MARQYRASLIGKKFCYGGKVYKIVEARSTALIPGPSCILRSVSGERDDKGKTLKIEITNPELLSLIGRQIDSGEDVADLRGYEAMS